MVAVVSLGWEFGHDKLRTAITMAVSPDACDMAAVRYLLTETALQGAAGCRPTAAVRAPGRDQLSGALEHDARAFARASCSSSLFWRAFSRVQMIPSKRIML